MREIKVTVGRVNQDVPGAINIRVDRASVLGNPYVTFPGLKDEGQRDMVCDAYALWFDARMRCENSSQRVEMDRIKDLLVMGHAVNLQCWCAPKRCHGLTIKAFLESAVIEF